MHISMLLTGIQKNMVKYDFFVHFSLVFFTFAQL
jgi:hypothetical protein